jgi:hypothetical protein
MSAKLLARIRLLFVMAPLGAPASVLAQADKADLSAPSCETAADCKGALPKICKVCDGGAESCAHWVCASGKCATQICGPS